MSGPRVALDTLAGHSFDAAVIGAGVNGASAAQHLAAQGYDVLLVDKGDFASGSSSRSSRLLHCGLRYLAPGSSMWEFARHPTRLTTALRMARQAMQSRAQFAATTPQRLRALTFAFPFYDDSPYAAWQIDLAFRILRGLGGGTVPLDYKRLSPRQAMATPLLESLRNRDALRGVAMFSEYQFDWPERIVVDTVLDAERLGATVRNYTPVKQLKRHGEGWRLTLGDEIDGSAAPVTVEATLVFNMAGIWIDQVSNRVANANPSRRITGTKGSHIVVRLPPECADYGIVTLNRKHEPFYCVPWRGLHYFGPTETLYDGNPDDIRPSEEEFAFLLDEANYLLPALGLKRTDVLFGWSGVRPLTYAPDQPMGARSRELHDFARENLPGLFAMTAGPVMTHRSAGEEVVRAAAAHLKPRRPSSEPSYAAAALPSDPDSPQLLNHDTAARLADIRRGVHEEHACTLVDVMFRRTGAGWSQTMGREGALVAAQIVGEELGWSLERAEQEAQDYIAFVTRQYRLADGD